jgi:addiction module HigA family antidote
MAEHTPAEVFPPGEYIRDELEARGWTQVDLAFIIGRPLQTVNEIVAGRKAITPETARGLAEAFGTSAEVWMNLESVYRRTHSWAKV